MNCFEHFNIRRIHLPALLALLSAGFLVALVWLPAAEAQNNSNRAQTNASPQGTASPAESPTPIPFSEVVIQAENASATLKEITSGIGSDTTAANIEGRLPALTNEINSRLEETGQVIEGATSLDQLRSFEADWNALTRNLPNWKDDLTGRAAKLEDDLRQVGELAVRWQGTREELLKTETPPEILGRVDEILSSAVLARREIESERSRIVTLLNRITEQQKRVSDAVTSIKQARESLVSQLLVRDSQPIWSPELWRRADVVQLLRDAVATQLTGLIAFASRNVEKLIIHFFVFAIFAAILIYLRRRARPHVEANPDLKQAAVIFYLPIATALVLAILFSSRIYPQTPQILGAIFGAIALIPTVIILRRLVERPLYPVLYSVVIFYFIDQLRVIADAVPAISRPLFLAEMLGGFLFFLWFYRAKKTVKVEEEDVAYGRIYRTVRIASIVVLPFFAAAFMANVLGYMNLALLLGNAILRSLYIAVILYAAVRIIDGLIVFALRFRPLNLLKMVQNYGPMIQERARKYLRWIALALWITATLETFTLRETVFSGIREILTAELNLGALSISAGDVLLFFALVYASFLISRLIRFVLEEDVFPRFSLAHGIPYAISTVLNYLILFAGFFLAVGAAGFDLTRFTVLVGAFGVGIGFGLQNIINNFVSGLILLFERPIKIGDEITIEEASGTVRRIGIRASIIKQWDNSEIIVPNSKLISESVKNWTRTGRKRGIELLVRVAHGTDTQLVTELLIRAATEHPLIVDKPPPQVLLDDFGAVSLNYKLRAWTNDYDKTVGISSDLAVAVSKSFAENNIAVPHPITNITDVENA